MDLGKFLKSQTFKTGTFVLFVLLVILIVFKFGFIHGYKKAVSPHGYGDNYSQMRGGTFFNHYKGMDTKGMEGMHEKFLMKKELMADKESGEENTDEEVADN